MDAGIFIVAYCFAFFVIMAKTIISGIFGLFFRIWKQDKTNLGDDLLIESIYNSDKNSSNAKVEDKEINNHLITDLSRVSFKQYDQVVSDILNDKRITPEEEKSLYFSASYLKIPRIYADWIVKKYYRYKILWDIEHKKLLLNIKVDVPLASNEECRWFILAAYLEEYYEKYWTGGYQGLSIKVMNGIYYRAGGSRGKLEHEKKTQSHRGILYLTNQRVVFTSQTKSFEIYLARIINFQIFKDVVLFQDGKSNFVFQTGNTEILSVLIPRIIKK